VTDQISRIARRLDTHLSVEPGTGLRIEGVVAEELAAAYGTPLHVMSGTRLRENYRRIRDAFAARWEPGVNVYFAIKSNPALAVRRVLAQEGAGGDCLGVPELQASLTAGTRPERLVLNGNNKPDDAIELAVRCGARINVDDLDEIGRVASIARAAGRVVPVGIRTKPERGALEGRPSEMMALSVGAYAEKSKWGLEPGDAVAAVRAIQACPELRPAGVHYHLGRHLAEPEMFAGMAPGLAALLARIDAETGWMPRSLTLGGGFTQGRDPFFRNPGDGGAWPRVSDSFVAPIEQFAGAVCDGLREALAALGLPLPVLGLEPGRYITASAGVTLTEVGTVKRGSDRTWVMVDACGTHLGLSRSPRDAHAVIAVADTAAAEVVCDVVGPLCVIDVIMEQAPLPAVARGDLLAVLDTGAYADGEASNANSIGRPAVVLVEGTRADLIRRRETFADVFARDTVPPHLAGAGAGSPWHEEEPAA
jgi:diaminopimelate decarboxylase